jgi:hypothetical protein
MIDDKHTFHSRGHPRGSLEIDVSALICVNQCYFLNRTPISWFVAHAIEHFVDPRRLHRQPLISRTKSVTQPKMNRTHFRLITVIYAYLRL